MALVIDSHCHAGPGDGLSGPWDSDAPLRAYLRRAQAAGITRSVLFAAFHSDYAIANHGVARLVASDPQHFYGFAFVHAGPASSACPCCTTRPARWPWPNCWHSSIPTSTLSCPTWAASPTTGRPSWR